MQTYEERTGHFLVDSKLALSNKLKKDEKNYQLLSRACGIAT